MRDKPKHELKLRHINDSWRSNQKMYMYFYTKKLGPCPQIWLYLEIISVQLSRISGESPTIETLDWREKGGLTLLGGNKRITVDAHYPTNGSVTTCCFCVSACHRPSAPFLPAKLDPDNAASSFSSHHNFGTFTCYPMFFTFFICFFFTFPI